MGKNKELSSEFKELIVESYKVSKINQNWQEFLEYPGEQ